MPRIPKIGTWVAIAWNDAITDDPGWTTVIELNKSPLKPERCVTVGMVATVNSRFVTLAQSSGLDRGDENIIGNLWTVPRGWITDVKTIDVIE